jgi:uncharacterized OsmC-like protein
MTGGDHIRSALEAATSHYAANPGDARSRDSLATATLREGLLVQVEAPTGERITTDMVSSVGGTGTAPSPGWLLRAAEASCVATLIAMRAATLGITLDTLEVAVDSESDDRGMLGMDDSVPAGPLTGRVQVRITADGADPATLEEMARWGVEHCPVCNALERPVPITVEVVTT